MSGWIGVDLDGCLAHYEGWQGPEHIGPPIKAMQERVIGWIQHGIDVRIFTARAFRGSTEEIAVIERWCEEHLGKKLPVTCVKDLAMEVLYDDRCVQVETNTGRLIRHGIQLVPQRPEGDLVGSVA